MLLDADTMSQQFCSLQQQPGKEKKILTITDKETDSCQP
jgi:hypothetical protein